MIYMLGCVCNASVLDKYTASLICNDAYWVGGAAIVNEDVVSIETSKATGTRRVS
jgi:hypothetical protein